MTFQIDPASPSYSGPAVLCALERGGLGVGKQSSREHANEPGEPPDTQSPCAWGLEGAECQLLGSWLVQLFQVRGTRRAGLVMAFHERPIACVPRCVCHFLVSIGHLMAQGRSGFWALLPRVHTWEKSRTAPPPTVVG